MNLVSGVQETTANGDAASAAISSNGEVSQLFTTLLVAQIRNQNPLEPQDPSEFVGQMTQLSQMEALQALAAQGSASGAMLESLQVLALGAQVGSTLTVATERLDVGAEPIQGRFTLVDGSAEVSLVLEGANGQRKQIPLGTRSAGDVAFSIDPQSLGLAPGTYMVRVDAKDVDRPVVEVHGTLRSVRLSPTSGVVLDVANIGQVGSAAVTGFNGQAGSPAQPSPNA